MMIHILLYLVPMMVANATPVLVKNLPWWNFPINIHYLWANKTWRWLIVWTMMWTLVWIVLSIQPEVSLSLSFGALLGDIIESSIKRHRGIKPGDSRVPRDQIDYIIWGCVLTWRYRHIHEVMLVMLVGWCISYAAHRISYYLWFISTKH